MNTTPKGYGKIGLAQFCLVYLARLAQLIISNYGYRKRPGPGPTEKQSPIRCNRSYTYCVAFPFLLLPSSSSLCNFPSLPFKKWDETFSHIAPQNQQIHWKSSIIWCDFSAEARPQNLRIRLLRRLHFPPLRPICLPGRRGQSDWCIPTIRVGFTWIQRQWRCCSWWSSPLGWFPSVAARVKARALY